MQVPNKNLYFVAMITPAGISDQITAFKQDIAINYNSKRALRVMPHITLKAPFTVDANRHNETVNWFTEMKSNESGFYVELQNFGVFDNSKAPVLFVNPLRSDELFRLQKHIIANFEIAFPEIPIQFIERDFHPHITIGYRDLTYAEFEKAWEVYKHKKYADVFLVENFCLLQHDGNRWNIIAINNLTGHNTA